MSTLNISVETDLWFVIKHKLYHVKPYSYKTSISFYPFHCEYVIKNYNDGERWTLNGNATYFDSEKSLVEKILQYYKYKRFGLITELMTGNDFLSSTKNFSYNSVPSNMAMWPYEKTFIEYPELKAVFNDKRVKL